jgi:hypothetical protein
MFFIPCCILYSVTFRYFFHATPHRTETEEYGLEDEDVEVPIAEEEFKVPDSPEDKGKSVEGTEQLEMDSSLAGWLKVGQDDLHNTDVHENSDTDTEDDSDHEGVRPDEGDDDWLKVKQSPDLASDGEKVS